METNNGDYIKQCIDAMIFLMIGAKQKAFDQLQSFGKGESCVRLMLLHNDGQEIVPSMLSKGLDIKSARVSAILNSLEKKGEITREINLKNRNNIIVKLTDYGKKRAMEDYTQTNESLARVFERMGEDDSRNYVRLINIFLEYLVDEIPNLP